MAGPTDGELIIETSEGARYGVKSLDVAARLYPGFSVISYADGRPFEATEAASKPPRKKAAPKRARKPRAVTPPVQNEEASGDGAE